MFYLKRAEANETYEKVVKTFIREDADGTISLTRCCEVGGLGGKNNRDGSFEYYLSEPIRDNDPKGVGPFIWASLEYEGVAGKGRK
ncbi:MAG: glycoside hydrolase family 88 protein [Rikenellaceae bacterium]|jgi:unsaturated rhamnogalacturonyl hydrolase|nr:glycoside hydrolase family 88 protein [Rikenellaceae bacterium]